MRESCLPSANTAGLHALRGPDQETATARSNVDKLGVGLTEAERLIDASDGWRLAALEVREG